MGRSVENNRVSVDFNWYQFAELSADHLYQLLKLRQDVFVLEQQSLYEDIDDMDRQAQHLLVFAEHSLLIGYLRVRGVSTESKIERIVLARSVRKQGLGAELVERAMQFCLQNHQPKRLILSAQCSAVGFYQRFGFSIEGKPYDDGGIMHQTMTKNVTAAESLS